MYIRSTNQSGFTVVEVMIFLAITGLMLVAVFMGMGTQISRTRFNDGMRSSQAFLQQQYNDVMSGLNLRGNEVVCDATILDKIVVTSTGATAGKTNCLLLGQLVTFDRNDGSQFVSYPVIGFTPTVSLNSTASIGEVIAAYKPWVVDDQSTIRRFDIPWGGTVTRTCRGIDMSTIDDEKHLLGSCTQLADKDVDSYLMLRSSVSGELLSFVFSGGHGLNKGKNLLSYINFAGSISEMQRQANICIKSPDFFPVYGGIRLGGTATAGQTAILAVPGMVKEDMEVACGKT